jgi:hypothetical protein
MKSKSTATAIKSMKADKKRIAYSAAADAIKSKLEEIKQDHHTYRANAASLALFGQNPFPAVPSIRTQTKSRQPQGLPAHTSHQLRLF